MEILPDGPPAAPATLVLAPGAGGSMRSPFMAQVADGLARGGCRVIRFDFLYTQQGRKAPDRAPVLERTFREVVDHVRGEAPRRLILGGKSMGGRIASHLVAADASVADGLVFLGYPLHPPGRPERIRDRHLYEIDVPMLFVAGTRDPFCPLGTLAEVRSRLPRSDLSVIQDGDHSFKVRRSSGRGSDEALAEVIEAVTGWVMSLE